MDWSDNEMQEAIKEVARPILRTAEDPWKELVQAEILGLDELADIATLLIEVGRTGARVPVFATLILGAPVHRAGLAKAGEVLTAGLIEPGNDDPRRASTVFRDGGLHGEKTCVPAHHASRIVVVAADGVYLADLADAELIEQQGTDDDPLGHVVFAGTPASKLGSLELLDWWLPRIEVGLCALLLGLSQTALRLTGQYVSKREQFGKPIGSFQAVQQRAADAWIDLQAMEVTLWQAAWRVQEGMESQRELAIARYWASEGSHNVCAAAQHLHGGFGFDRDYELHRYFLAAKQHEFLLGGAAAQLERLGDLLAAPALAPTAARS